MDRGGCVADLKVPTRFGLLKGETSGSEVRPTESLVALCRSVRRFCERGCVSMSGVNFGNQENR
jgi:hypothetical protein